MIHVAQIKKVAQIAIMTQMALGVLSPTLHVTRWKLVVGHIAKLHQTLFALIRTMGLQTPGVISVGNTMKAMHLIGAATSTMMILIATKCVARAVEAWMLKKE